MNDIHTPLHYFLQVLIPAFREFGEGLTNGVIEPKRDLKALAHIAEACLHLADHIAADDAYRSAIPGAPRSKQYIKELARRSRDFAITKDIANALKHRKITDTQRTIDGVNSLEEAWGIVRYEDSKGPYFGTTKVLIVQLADGRALWAEDVIRSCIALWTDELLRLGIIDRVPLIEGIPNRDALRSELPDRPRIKMKIERDLYMNVQAHILCFNRERKRLERYADKIGQIEVDIEWTTHPSALSRVRSIERGIATIKVTDN